ncbi:MAG: M23 family metallopeptidase [Thermoanaerobaculum sp.]
MYEGQVLPNPPGPPGHPWDQNSDGKLDCWKATVMNYDPLSETGYCQQYGATSPPCSRGHIHKGQDVVAPCGSVVRAPGRGKVVNIFYGSGSGNSLLMQVEDGMYVAYFHLAEVDETLQSLFNAEKKPRIYPGQVVGTVGNTGCGSCGCHLHVQVQTVQDTTTDISNTLDPKVYFGNC